MTDALPELRAIQQKDAEQVALLHSNLDHSGWNLEQWQQAIEVYPCTWVLEQDATIIGYAAYQSAVSQVELLNIGIDRQYQGKGLAKYFLQATLVLLPVTTEAVYLEVRRSNVPAIGLYTKLGFEKVGERSNYYAVAGGAREDALIYKLKVIN